MATAKEFVERVSEVNGVTGCVLIRENGDILAGNFEDPDLYTSLMILGGGSARDIINTFGFSHCSHLSFYRKGREHFNLFPIGKFYLGVMQSSTSDASKMLPAVLRLIGRVTTGSSTVED